MQCIERAIEHLPVTHLEIVTLTYAAMYFVIYVFWWNKSLDVKFWPVQVFRKSDPATDIEPQVSRFRRIWAGRGAVPGQKTYLRDAEIDLGGNRQWLGNFITGCQGEYLNLSREDRVPEFWADSDNFAIADLIVLSVGTCFRAIRCIACFFLLILGIWHVIWCYQSSVLSSFLVNFRAELWSSSGLRVKSQAESIVFIRKNLKKKLHSIYTTQVSVAECARGTANSASVTVEIWPWR